MFGWSEMRFRVWCIVYLWTVVVYSTIVYMAAATESYILCKQTTGFHISGALYNCRIRKCHFPASAIGRMRIIEMPLTFIWPRFSPQKSCDDYSFIVLWLCLDIVIYTVCDKYIFVCFTFRCFLVAFFIFL